MLVFEERGKPECLEKNLSEQSIEPTNSAQGLEGDATDTINTCTCLTIKAPILLPNNNLKCKSCTHHEINMILIVLALLSLIP